MTTRKLVILHTETLKRWGGQQNRVLSEAIGLGQRGHTMIITCHKGSILAQRARDAGVKVYEVNMVKQAYAATVPLLVNIIRREGVDIVSTHSSVDSWAGGIAALLTKRKLVRFKHNLNAVKGDLFARFIYSLPDRFITVNNAAADVLGDAGHIGADKIERVYGSIDAERFDPGRISEDQKTQMRSSLGIPSRALVVGNTSGFTSVKGQRYLVEAAQRLFSRREDVFLLLIGRVGRHEPLLDAIQSRFKQRIILPGLRTDIPELLSVMDIFVFPSVTEAFGNSMIEAMAMAKPVLASDISSFREFMIDGENGAFFRRGDSNSLYEALMRLIAEPELLQKLGSYARRTVLEKFSPKRMIEETERVYYALMATRT